MIKAPLSRGRVCPTLWISHISHTAIYNHILRAIQHFRCSSQLYHKTPPEKVAGSA